MRHFFAGILELVQEHGASFHSSSAVDCAIGGNISDKEANVVRKLRRMAPKASTVSSNLDQLIMFLTGPAGCGKSHSLFLLLRSFARTFVVTSLCHLMRLHFTSPLALVLQQRFGGA